jgi:hypothetical protein
MSIPGINTRASATREDSRRLAITLWVLGSLVLKKEYIKKQTQLKVL